MPPPLPAPHQTLPAEERTQLSPSRSSSEPTRAFQQGPSLLRDQSCSLVPVQTQAQPQRRAPLEWKLGTRSSWTSLGRARARSPSSAQRESHRRDGKSSGIASYICPGSTNTPSARSTSLPPPAARLPAPRCSTLGRTWGAPRSHVAPSAGPRPLLLGEKPGQLIVLVKETKSQEKKRLEVHKPRAGMLLRVGTQSPSRTRGALGGRQARGRIAQPRCAKCNLPPQLHLSVALFKHQNSPGFAKKKQPVSPAGDCRMSSAVSFDKA